PRPGEVRLQPRARGERRGRRQRRRRARARPALSLPGPAPDVEDVIVGTNAVRPAQHLVVHAQLGIVVDAAEVVSGCGGLSRPDLFSLGGHILVVRSSESMITRLLRLELQACRIYWIR